MEPTTEKASAFEKAVKSFDTHKEWVSYTVSALGGAEIGASWIQAGKVGFQTVLAGGVENVVNFATEAGAKLAQLNVQGATEAIRTSFHHPHEAAAVASAVAALVLYAGGVAGIYGGIALANEAAGEKQ